MEALPFRLSSGRVIQTTPVFELYWQFAAERQRIFFKRVRGEPSPWTDNPILRAFRFTNAYRASDRVSQYLIREVIYKGAEDIEEVFFRILLFKLFNRIETWELLLRQIGELAWKTFRFDRYEKVLDAATAAGKTIYSPAYVMPCPALGARRKHSNHLLLLEKMLEEKVPKQIALARTLEEVYRILRGQPSLGEFLAFQYAVDINYSNLTDFSEMDFVVAGPGARSGIRKAFVNLEGISPEDIIKETTIAAEEEFSRRDIQFDKLGKRALQLIDCQNLFCEIDKYSRAALPLAKGNGRTRIKRRYSTTASPRELPQWYPPKWDVQVV